MQIPADTPKDQVKQIRILFLGMLVAILVFMAAVIFLVSDRLKQPPPEENIFLWVTVILIIVFVPAGFIAYRKILGKTGPADNLSQKLQTYTSALIVRLALLEGVILFGLVGTLVRSDYRIFFMILLVLFYFMMNYPSKVKLVEHLRLSKEETDAIS